MKMPISAFSRGAVRLKASSISDYSHKNQKMGVDGRALMSEIPPE
jgi:hypothetical protein